MTLLDRVAGGNILGPKEERERDFSGTRADSDAIRARIKADLLPYQRQSLKTPNIGSLASLLATAQQEPNDVRLDCSLCSR